MRASAVAPLVTVVALTLAACGDASDDIDATEPPPATDAATTAPAGDGAATTAPAEEEEVVMQDISFEPDEVTVPVGSTVMWTNQDTVAHTSTSEDDVWGSGEMAQGDSFSHTFEEPGTYTYICEIHPAQMEATVVVED